MALLRFYERTNVAIWDENISADLGSINAEYLQNFFNRMVNNHNFNLEIVGNITDIHYYDNGGFPHLIPVAELVLARQNFYRDNNANRFVTVTFRDTTRTLPSLIIDHIQFGNYPDGANSLFDALIGLLIQGNVDQILYALNANQIMWTYGGSGDYYNNDALNRVRGYPAVSNYIRLVLPDIDIQPHVDDPMDLEFNTIIPTNPRTFGLEIEFLDNGRSQQHYATALTDALEGFERRWPVIVRGYGHSDGSFWDLKTDSSCGYELASPALTWEDWPQVDTVLRTIYKAGARINDRCGFHVHHAAQDLKATGLRRLLLLWAAYEETIMLSVKEGRRDNRYCISLRNGMDWNQFKEQLSPIHNMNQAIARMGRYRSLNATGWWQNGRIEIRLYQGTLHPNSCKFWVYLTQQLVEIAKVTRSYEQLDRAVQSTLQENLDTFKMTLYNKFSESNIDLVHTFEDVVKQRNNSLQIA